eukprot:gene11814-18232_t
MSVYEACAIVGVDRADLQKHGITLPCEAVLSSGDKVVVDLFPDGLVDAGLDAFNAMIDEGNAWPFEDRYDEARFRSYFLSHAAFAVTLQGQLAGLFYIKPNFPGRCSHVANGGFITLPTFRRRGIARLMGQLFLRAAPALGYKVACFNLEWYYPKLKSAQLERKQL